MKPLPMSGQKQDSIPSIRWRLPVHSLDGLLESLPLGLLRHCDVMLFSIPSIQDVPIDFGIVNEPKVARHLTPPPVGLAIIPHFSSSEILCWTLTKSKVESSVPGRLCLKNPTKASYLILLNIGISASGAWAAGLITRWPTTHVLNTTRGGCGTNLLDA